MPSTITLATTENWASAYSDFTSLNIGSGNEPTITNANTILQTILGPPFKWNWNRSAISAITTVVGQQDYPITVSNFGFLEGASVAIGTATYAIKEIKQELTQQGSASAGLGRPESIAAQVDNNAGTITFRFLPVPDQIYTVTPYQQQAPTLFTATSGTWAPIPDKFQYLYNWGFLALTLLYDDNPMFPMINQKFVAHLLGAQQGLSETERNMFLDSWNILTRQQEVSQMKSQQGRQALGT